MKQIAEVFQINEQFLWEAMPKSPIKKQETKIDSNGQKQNQSQSVDIYKRLFGLLIVYPENISYIADSLEMEMIKDEKWRGFYNDLILLYNKENRLSRNQLEKLIEQKENDRFDQGFFDSLGLIIQQQFLGFSEQEIQNELIFLAKRIKKNYLREKIDHITEKIKQLESRSESDNEVKKLFEEFQKLTWQISQLD
jgi:replicative DNA helicase